MELVAPVVLFFAPPALLFGLIRFVARVQRRTFAKYSVLFGLACGYIACYLAFDHEFLIPSAVVSAAPLLDSLLAQLAAPWVCMVIVVLGAHRAFKSTISPSTFVLTSLFAFAHVQTSILLGISLIDPDGFIAIVTSGNGWTVCH